MKRSFLLLMIAAMLGWMSASGQVALNGSLSYVELSDYILHVPIKFVNSTRSDRMLARGELSQLHEEEQEVEANNDLWRTVFARSQWNACEVEFSGQSHHYLAVHERLLLRLMVSDKKITLEEVTQEDYITTVEPLASVYLGPLDRNNIDDMVIAINLLNHALNTAHNLKIRHGTQDYFNGYDRYDNANEDEGKADQVNLKLNNVHSSMKGLNDSSVLNDVYREQFIDFYNHLQGKTLVLTSSQFSSTTGASDWNLCALDVVGDKEKLHERIREQRANDLFLHDVRIPKYQPAVHAFNFISAATGATLGYSWSSDADIETLAALQAHVEATAERYQKELDTHREKELEDE